MRNKILHLLNIRSDEVWLVKNLFWLQFFQGFSIAVFNISAFILFLEHFHETDFASVYLFAAVLLLIAGYTYSKFEHSMHIKNLVLGVILFMALSIAFFMVLLLADVSKQTIFVMFSWYYVIYLLSNLEFWGVAALMFDIRQSKRLFGMIGTGDLAKLIVYSAWPILHTVTNIENLLVVSLVSLLCSLIFYFRLKRTGALELHVKHVHEPAAPEAHASKKYSADNLRSMVKSYAGNKLIAYVAFLSFIIVTCVTLISFAFYAEVKHEAHTDEQLMSFIVVFYASGTALALLIRLGLTGRLSNSLGIKGALLVSPVILFGFLIFIVSIQFFGNEHHVLLYTFGLMAILTEVLKSALQDPVFITVMQPLSSHLRLRGHTVVKGLMYPFAMAFAAAILFGLMHFNEKINLFTVSYILMALLLIWVVMIYVVDREYLSTLVTALNKRYSVGTEINLSGEKTLATLEQKINDGETIDAVFVLNIIEKHYKPELQYLVLKALAHPKREVRMEAIKLVEQRKIMEALPLIENIIAKGAEGELVPEAVKAKCMLVPDDIENFDELIEVRDPRLMKAAVTGLMTSGGISAVVSAGQKLLQLIVSDNTRDRVIAAEIIGELGIHSFYKPLIQLLNDKQPDVVRAAIEASGKVKNIKVVKLLMDIYINHQYEKEIIQALNNAGDVSMPEIKKVLTEGAPSRRQQTRLILLCGRIGTEKSISLLTDLIWNLPDKRAELFHALHLCNFKAAVAERERFTNLMHHYIESAISILFMIQELQNNKTSQLLVDALYIELNEIRDSLLLLFSFLFDKEKMMKAKNAFMINKKESVANAMEMIELEVPKDLSLMFGRIYEPGNINEKCAALRTHLKKELNYDIIIESVLNSKKYHFHRWTKAAALHSLIFYPGQAKVYWLEQAEKENDILLKQTAQKILAELN